MGTGLPDFLREFGLKRGGIVGVGTDPYALELFQRALGILEEGYARTSSNPRLFFEPAGGGLPGTPEDARGGAPPQSLDLPPLAGSASCARDRWLAPWL